MKKKTLLKLVIAIPLCLVLALGIGAYAMFATQIKAIGSFQKLADGLYYVEYAGDYGFSAFLERGGAASSGEVAGYISEFLSKGFYRYELSPTDQGCSTISVGLPGGGYGFGRNFDWEECTAVIAKTIPKDGYASISTVNLDFLGFGDGFVPESFINKYLSLGAVYVPLDGINEKGLCVADLVIDYPEETHQDTGRPNLTTTTAIRLLLDRAASVEEAIALLGQYDMHADIGSMHHLAVSDPSGRAVVVEYIGNAMRVTDMRIVTNFFLTPGELYGVGSEESRLRFDTLTQLSNEASGVMDMEHIKESLAAVRQSVMPDGNWTTQWSIVYDLSEPELLFYHRENYDRPYSFRFR